jgi:hypothetical protein
MRKRIFGCLVASCSDLFEWYSRVASVGTGGFCTLMIEVETANEEMRTKRMNWEMWWSDFRIVVQGVAGRYVCMYTAAFAFYGTAQPKSDTRMRSI